MEELEIDDELHKLLNEAFYFSDNILEKSIFDYIHKSKIEGVHIIDIFLNLKNDFNLSKEQVQNYFKLYFKFVKNEMYFILSQDFFYNYYRVLGLYNKLNDRLNSGLLTEMEYQIAVKNQIDLLRELKKYSFDPNNSPKNLDSLQETYEFEIVETPKNVLLEQNEEEEEN